MSLILEALKKSEAERRLGQVPGLLDSQPLARRRRGAGWRLPALAVAVLAVAAGAYWLGQRGAGEDMPPAAAAREDAAPARAITPTADAAEDENEDEALPELVLSPPASSPAAPVSRLPSDPGFRSVERESVPQHVQALPPPDAAPEPAPTVSPIAAPPPARPTQQPSLPVTEAPAIAPEPIAAAADVRPFLPSLSQLSAAQREGLPPLRMSMHVYTEDPATRVVIIDGRRLREGEALAAGLQLEAIERDGSVLDYRGLRFRLPRP